VERRYAVICNPAAAGGRGRRRLPAVVDELARRRVDHRVVSTRDIGHAREEARAAAAAGERVIAIGGDGLLRPVAAELRDSGSSLAIVPGGRGNDLARVLGIPYPGGPLLDRLAEEGDDGRYRFPHPRTDGPYDFSFSGLKTAVVNRAHNLRQLGEEIVPADFAASFRRAVVDMLVEKSVRAAADLGVKRLAAAGGVAANRLLRRELARRGEAAGLEVFLPPVELCTDNAAMIASAAYYRLLDGEVAGLGLNALPSIRMFD